MAEIHEIFNKVRVGKCLHILGAIVENMSVKNQFTYEIRAPFPVQGKTIDDLKNEYFEIGPDKDNLKAVPFLDLLVIIDLLIQWNYHHEQGRPMEDFRPEIITQFSDERIAHYLSQVKVQTPLLHPK